MNITEEERTMYEVMKAIYDSGIPLSFKGAMVLKACLLEAGYTDEIRHTADIDANWVSASPPTSAQMASSIQTAIEKSGLNVEVQLKRMYGEGRSAGFKVLDHSTGKDLFSMDIDVNRPETETQIYNVSDMRFSGVSPTQMMADKVSVVSTDKVFRRIKDLIDLYYMSKVFDFSKDDVLQTLKSSGRQLGNFDAFLHRLGDLQHAYEKFYFSGGVYRPPFEKVYTAVKEYVKDILPEKERTLTRPKAPSMTL